jgi:hypothetical protein
VAGSEIMGQLFEDDEAPVRPSELPGPWRRTPP